MNGQLCQAREHRLHRRRETRGDDAVYYRYNRERLTTHLAIEQTRKLYVLTVLFVIQELRAAAKRKE